MAKDALSDWLNFMKRQGKSYCMVHRAKVYVPTCNGGCEDAADDLRLQLTELFGGATSWKGRGTWYDDGGKLWDEPVMVVEAAHEPLCADKAEKFAEIIDNYQKRTGEDSISIDANGGFFITKGTFMKPMFGERQWEKGGRRLLGF